MKGAELSAGESQERNAGQRLTTHEAVCAERHDAIKARLARIETILIASAGGTIMLLINAIVAGRGA